MEVECINHDWREAIPKDVDKMASVNPDEAIWIVPTRKDAHKVVEALYDPPDGVPRVHTTYAKNTPPDQFTIEEPGLTAIYTFAHVRDSMLEYEDPWK